MTSEIWSTIYSNGAVALKSVSWTFDGGIPDAKDAWLAPGIITTGYEYLDLSKPIEELFI